MIVYHYTTKEGFDDIKRTGTLRRSDPWTTMDAEYGTGWYFTDLDPHKCDLMVISYCWNNTTDIVLSRVAYYFKFDINESILVRTRDHVYMVEKWDEALIKYISGEKSENCGKKPCNTCENAKKYR
ncbi:MAG: HYD1 signature containing ADP-ribosyltransferase family protein [Dehalococcoidales bacterium]